MVVLVLAVGCGQAGLGNKSWHQKFDWKAEKYFDDPQVITLCNAIEANDLEEMERLIQAGADVNAKGKGNMTPLVWAFPDNKPERLEKLLEYGADPNVVVTSDFNTKMSGIVPGDSVTHLACRTHFPKYFELVFDHGGDPNLVNEGDFENTPIFAVITGPAGEKLDKIKRLAELGANLDVQVGGATAAMQATTWGGQYDIALALLEIGADHRIFLENNNSRLVHTVISEERRLSVMTPEQKADYDKLVQWLKDHGESFDEARADFKRWESWAVDLTKYRMKLDREIAERKQREAREKRAAEKEAAANGGQLVDEPLEGDPKRVKIIPGHTSGRRGERSADAKDSGP
jgi:hypothetical protein